MTHEVRPAYLPKDYKLFHVKVETEIWAGSQLDADQWVQYVLDDVGMKTYKVVKSE